MQAKQVLFTGIFNAFPASILSILIANMSRGMIKAKTKSQFGTVAITEDQAIVAIPADIVKIGGNIKVTAKTDLKIGLKLIQVTIGIIPAISKQFRATTQLQAKTLIASIRNV